MSNALKAALKTKVIYANKLTLEEIDYLRDNGFTVILRSTTGPAPAAHVSAPWVIPERFQIQPAKVVRTRLAPKACTVQHAAGAGHGDERHWR